MGQADVPRGVLWHTGLAIPWAQPDDRRAVAKDIEETERGRIHPALWVHGGGQGNGPWGDESGQNSVGIVAKVASEIEFHRLCVLENDPLVKAGTQESRTKFAVALAEARNPSMIWALCE